MATTDDLIIAIRADMGQLQNQLNAVNAQLLRTQQQGNSAGDAIKGMAVQFLSLGAAIEGLKKLVDVNREFGILKAGLETATGSAQGANEAFGALQQFAQQTPYDLAQSVSAFTQLVNLGLTPSERALKSYGDTSAALGKDLKQMVEAVADAATGEFERLKEFGIKSKNQGDTIAFTFKGTKEVVKNNAADIENYLIRLGEINFNGAMEKRMASLDGAISNLSDAFDGFFYNIGESGATDALNSGLRKLGDGLVEINNYIKNISVVDFKDGISALGDAIELVAGYKITKFVASLALTAQETVVAMAAQSALRIETLAVAEADAAAAGIAVRRSIAEKELALDELNRARASSATALATQQAAIADAERANMEAVLAAGTQNSVAADLAKTIAADRVAAAQVAVSVTAAEEAAAVRLATTASAINTEAVIAQTAAQTALAVATTEASVAARTAGTVLTGLGGPLGAIVTVLGLGATAWLVFGDHSETAAEKAEAATKRIKDSLIGVPDDMQLQTDALIEVNNKIKDYNELTSDIAPNSARMATVNKRRAELQAEKAQIEENINNLKLGKILSEIQQEDALGKFKVSGSDSSSGADPKEAEKAKKAAEQSAKQFAQLKEQAQRELNAILEKNMSEDQLDKKHYKEQAESLKAHLQDGTLTKTEYLSGIIALNEQADKKTTELMIAQHETEKAINDKNAEEDFAQHAARLEQLGILMDGVRQGGMTELEIMDEQHAQKMQKMADFHAADAAEQAIIDQLKLEAEAQYQAKRLDLILGTGNKIQTMQRAFEKGNLQGALSFFAADFGGMSQHSRKMFELTKAARLAVALIDVPSTIIAAAKHGAEIGGWPLGLAMGAAAAASQLANLRAIQSASFGGGGGGSSGGSGGGVSAPTAQSAPQEQAPLQQRFVNIGLSGSDNTMYTKDAVRELIKRLNEEVKDGAVLRVN